MTDLLQRAQNRTDAHQFRKLYMDLAPRVKTYLCRRGAGPETAKRLARECLLRAWRLGAHSVSDYGGIKLWVFVLARNMRLHGCQNEFVWQALPSTKAPDANCHVGAGTNGHGSGAGNREIGKPILAKSPPDRRPRTTLRIAQRARHLDVKEAVTALSSIERDLLKLSFLDGLSLDEIASRRQRSRSWVADHMKSACRTIFKNSSQATTQQTECSIGAHPSGCCDPYVPGITITTHPSAVSLTGYASGGLAEPFCAVVATHLDLCTGCREHVRQLEILGGKFLSDLTPGELLDPFPSLALRAQEAEVVTPSRSPSPPRSADVPLPLAQFIGNTLADIDWQSQRSGVWLKKIPLIDRERDRLMLVKFAPGSLLPVLAPSGSRVHWGQAIVLQGFVHGTTKTYTRGDYLEADAGDLRNLQADEFEGCICLMARETTRWGFSKFLHYLLGKRQPRDQQFARQP